MRIKRATKKGMRPFNILISPEERALLIAEAERLNEPASYIVRRLIRTLGEKKP